MSKNVTRGIPFRFSLNMRKSRHYVSTVIALAYISWLWRANNPNDKCQKRPDSHCIDLIMEANLVKVLSLLLWLTITAGIVTGEHRAICPTQTVEAEEGDDVTFQSHLDPRVNLENFTADWKRVDLRNRIVHAYRHRQDNPDAQISEYRGRTTLDHEDLKKGTLTLQITSVRPSDSGKYKCYVPNWTASCTIDLRVVRRGQKNGTKMDTPSTTRPPTQQVTKLDVSGGENRTAVRAGIISSVSLISLILCVLVVVLTLKRRNIQAWRTRPRRCKEQKEMKKLNPGAAEGSEDLEGPAEKMV